MSDEPGKVQGNEKGEINQVDEQPYAAMQNTPESFDSELPLEGASGTFELPVPPEVFAKALETDAHFQDRDKEEECISNEKAPIAQEQGDTKEPKENPVERERTEGCGGTKESPEWKDCLLAAARGDMQERDRLGEELDRRLRQDPSFMRRVNQFVDPDNTFQDVLFTAFQKLLEHTRDDRVKVAQNWFGWFYRVAVRELMKCWAKEQRDCGRLAPLPEDESPETPIPSDVTLDEFSRWLRMAVRCLTVDEWIVLQLIMRGVQQCHIAELMDKSETSISRWKTNARRTLKDAWKASFSWPMPGNNWLSMELKSLMIDAVKRMTVEERSVLLRIRRGHTTAEIAQALSVDTGTVKQWINHILRILGTYPP